MSTRSSNEIAGLKEEEDKVLQVEKSFLQNEEGYRHIGRNKE